MSHDPAADEPPAVEPIQPAQPTQPHVAIISGLSGAGKTAASKLLEDVGYRVIDNLPAELLRGLAQLVARETSQFERVALVLDARSGNPAVAYREAVHALESRAITPQVFFLEARDDVLIRRFSETRHRHPLDSDEGGVADSIERERDLLADIRAEADVIIDTSELSGRQLRERLYSALDLPDDNATLAVQLISFGYKHGIPLEADMVFDVRFMENPFYIDRLRPLNGLDDEVRKFVLSKPITEHFVRSVTDLIEFVMPGFRDEGRSRLTIGFGCTGGQHRSIAISEEVARRLRETGSAPVTVWHRELERT